jgi:hypothetical protein
MTSIDTNFQAPSFQNFPENFVKFIQYYKGQKDKFCGYFRLNLDEIDSSDGAYCWFDKDEKVAKRFTVFGSGPDGSLYVFWLYDQQTVLTAPVVYLDSEGLGNAVIANDFTDFLALLSLGIDQLGYVITNHKSDRGRVINNNGLLQFRKWLQDELCIETPHGYEEIVATAQQNHPNLEKWIQKWADARYGVSRK